MDSRCKGGVTRVRPGLGQVWPFCGFTVAIGPQAYARSEDRSQVKDSAARRACLIGQAVRFSLARVPPVHGSSENAPPSRSKNCTASPERSGLKIEA
jgi:hypothetical protein